MSGKDTAAGKTSAGNPMKDEFFRNRSLYLIFHAANFMLLLVNKLEQTFARSLVECEVPVSEFTGSALCGDRLFVIDQGQKLSSTGQGLECFFKVLAMLFLAVVADVIGRKPVLVLGIVCTGVSAICFLVATSSPGWLAFRLFALGQGLQGAYPAELLGGIVANDISNESRSDPVVVQKVSGAIFMLLAMVAEISGIILNSSESMDFRTAWVVVAIVNCLIALAAVFLCRETIPEFGDDRGKNGIVQGVKMEMREYSNLLVANKILRLNLIMFAFFAVSMVAKTVDMSFYIAFHGVSQADAVKHFGCNMFFAIAFFGLVDKICQRFGTKSAFVIVILALNFCNLLIPLFLTSPMVFMLHQYAMMMFAGMPALTNTIDSRWFDHRMTSKFLSMKSLVQYVSGIVANPLYGRLFNAHATSYFSRLAPYGLVLASTWFQTFLLLGPLWRTPGGLPKVLERIDQERAEKANTVQDVSDNHSKKLN